jgi:ribosomal protein L18E
LNICITANNAYGAQKTYRWKEIMSQKKITKKELLVKAAEFDLKGVQKLKKEGANCKTLGEIFRYKP